ncbi:MAG: putative SnoaL-like aldol condensation-catalyzing enzyme [Saprospiraceae bacterium]|jgi:predicted SnoaL-like aldol condensation-catalyzing enzyme
MENLDSKFQKEIDVIAKNIQDSEALSEYLDTEEYEQYKGLIEAFEPAIQELYLRVAGSNPLQVMALETALLVSELEGLYMPKITGYSVLRGEANENLKYRKPQDHFKSVLIAVVNSSNFEMVKLRVGQSIQMGFAFSSDIWITNLIESVSNQRVKYFLQSQKLPKYRNILERKIGIKKYKKQFESLNYYTVVFPNTALALQGDYYSLRTFLLERGKNDYENTSLNDHLNEFINNEALKGESEYLKIILIIGLFFELDATGKKGFAEAFSDMVKKNPNFSGEYFEVLDEMFQSDEIHITPDADKRLAQLINGKADDEVNLYYTLMNAVHGKGFVHEDSIEAVQTYYGQHEGLSLNNKCLRAGLLNYFTQVMENLPPASYLDYFEMNKTFIQYINIFGNQKFNQAVKDLSLLFVKKLLKSFVDKRGRDYQDIKKFVKATFLDLGFMKDKELVELFKTKRKKKPVE